MADNKEGTSDFFISLIMLLMILGAFAWALWFLWGDQIGGFIRWIRVAQMWPLQFILPDDYAIDWRGYQVNFKEWLAKAIEMQGSQVDVRMMGLLSSLALMPYRYFFAAAIAAMGFWAYLKGPKAHYRGMMNLTQLIEHQSKVFPYITPFVKYNPASRPSRSPGSPVPAEMPLFAEALGPEEWLAYHSIPIKDKKIDEKVCAKAFAQQLGPRWRGAKALAPYRQVLLAACCLKVVRKRTDADDLLGRLAVCWSHDKGLKLDRKLLKDAQKVLKNRDLAGKTIELCNQHAFENTALIRALNHAREEGGVLAPAQFVWLRGHDRTLWYPLNNLGRNSFHMEALGAMSHYKSEKLAQRPIPMPKVNMAVQSIQEYLDSSVSRPIPALDYSNSKQRSIKKLKTA